MTYEASAMSSVVVLLFIAIINGFGFALVFFGGRRAARRRERAERTEPPLLIVAQDRADASTRGDQRPWAAL